MQRVTYSGLFRSSLAAGSAVASSSGLSSSFLSSFSCRHQHGGGDPTAIRTVAMLSPRLVCQPRHMFDKIKSAVGLGSGRKGSDADAELQPQVYDKENVRYTGKIFGVSTDTIFFYAKVVAVGLTVYVILWTFFAGYQYLASFSLASVGRLGFMAGFWTCAVLFSTFLQFKKRYTISPNAVYNQSIAMVMKDKEVVEFLGTYPKTGDFRAYNATGGFKLPLMRRIRSGSYEIGDLLGTKPQKLQMMFVLRSGTKEALVSCDVRKFHTQLLSSKYQFKSLAVHLKDTAKKGDAESKSMVLIGRDEDVVFRGFMKF